MQNLLRDQMSTDPRFIMERIRRSRGQVTLTPQIRVEADPRTNSLIVSGPQRTVALAETMIEQLDRPDETADRTYLTYTPTNADATALAPSVKRIVDATRSSGRRSTLELIADARSGAIVVVGSEDEVDRAMTLLKQWDDNALATPQMDLKIVGLEHSEAAVIANTLTPLLNDQARRREINSYGQDLTHPQRLDDDPLTGKNRG